MKYSFFYMENCTQWAFMCTFREALTARITKADYLLAKSAFHGICGSFRNIGSSVMNFGILIRLLKIYIYSVKSCNIRSAIFII